MRRFEGRVAFVTGAAHGIGRAIAVRLAEEGASVVVADVEAGPAQELADRLNGPDGQPERDAGPRAMAIACDVAADASVAAAIDAAVDRFGRLDVLVNNAGIGSGMTFADPGDDEWNRMAAVNLTGPVRCIQRALPHLLAAPAGNVVTIGSVNGIAAFGAAAYSMTKAAVHHLAKSLTAEYGRRGVRFNVVAPGTVRTRVWDGREEQLATMRDRLYPLGRVGEPQDIAAAVAFLASDDAGWISGVVLPVDGGALVGPMAGFVLEDPE